MTITEAKKSLFDKGNKNPSESEINDEIKRLLLVDKANRYQRERASEYPSTGDQLDMIMKDMRDGTKTHQEACEAVKAKYPKPE